MQWMVIFLGLGLDAVDGHISGVRVWIQWMVIFMG